MWWQCCCCCVGVGHGDSLHRSDVRHLKESLCGVCMRAWATGRGEGKRKNWREEERRHWAKLRKRQQGDRKNVRAGRSRYRGAWRQAAGPRDPTDFLERFALSAPGSQSSVLRCAGPAKEEQARLESPATSQMWWTRLLGTSALSSVTATISSDT